MKVAVLTVLAHVALQVQGSWRGPLYRRIEQSVLDTCTMSG